MNARRAAGALILLVSLAACHRQAALPVLPIGGDFALTDHNGQRFELASLRGRAVLIFFGYTFCPDACPTTLSKLSSVYRRLGPDAKRVKTLYISVDPQRDTPAVLKADLANFDVDAVGLTGSKPEIDTVVKAFGAAYEIVPMPNSAAKYSVAHTTSLYALDPSGHTRIEFAYEASVDEIVYGLQRILAEPVSPAPAPAPVQAGPVVHALKGTVLEVDVENGRIGVEHEPIPGFMNAMTTELPVKDRRELEHVSRGDTITARLVTSGGELWLEGIAVQPPDESKSK